MPSDKASAIVVPDARMPFVSTAKSQATAIEQTRAVAEVHGAIMVAQRCPRDKPRAIQEMEESCRIPALAERAFFRFPRAGQTISGPSVHLARELARCWGNLDYGVKELARDDENGQSEMLAFAWDLETNTRSETTFIVPHKRDKRGGAEALTDMRDIYENNANNGARRLRECIFAILPPWFTESAKEICAATLKKGGGKPRDQRLADCIKSFGSIGINRERLERKIGAPADRWTDVDLANLGVVFKSIQRGEVSKDDEFPTTDGDAQPPQPSRLDALEATITEPAAPSPRAAEEPAGGVSPPAPPAAPTDEFGLPLLDEPALAPGLYTPDGEVIPRSRTALADWRRAWADELAAKPETAAEWLDKFLPACIAAYADKPAAQDWIRRTAAELRGQ